MLCCAPGNQHVFLHRDKQTAPDCLPEAKPEDLSANEYLLGYLLRSGAVSKESLLTFRPSVCNRLDRNTTGLLLMGKSLAGSQKLS